MPLQPLHLPPLLLPPPEFGSSPVKTGKGRSASFIYIYIHIYTFTDQIRKSGGGTHRKKHLTAQRSPPDRLLPVNEWSPVCQVALSRWWLGQLGTRGYVGASMSQRPMGEKSCLIINLYSIWYLRCSLIAYYIYLFIIFRVNKH